MKNHRFHQHGLSAGRPWWLPAVLITTILALLAVQPAVSQEQDDEDLTPEDAQLLLVGAQSLLQNTVVRAVPDTL